MIIITDNETPRCAYITRLLLQRLMCADLRHASAPKDGEAVIAYTRERPSYPCIHIRPHGLLEQKAIRPQSMDMGRWDDLPVFFLTEADLPFDIFSAAFFLVSRYEEYLPHEKDEYGRYSHQNSLAFREGFLGMPLVEQWVMKLRERVGLIFPAERLGTRDLSFVPTYDIDHAWCYLHKGSLRTAGQLARDLLAGRFTSLVSRLRVLRGTEKDPYDMYEWLDALHRRHGLEACYFFPLAVRVQGYDRNVSPYSESLRALMAGLDQHNRTGIHPSWRSGDSETVFRVELSLFHAITGHAPGCSRFHYIRFTLPQDYRKLLRYDIREDHSMGYGTVNGFRASVSMPFPWYDLEKEEETPLEVHPYCWMDANSHYEQGCSPEDAFTELMRFHELLRDVNGRMVTISHNNFLGTGPGFVGWRDMYQRFLDRQAERGDQPVT